MANSRSGFAQLINSLVPGDGLHKTSIPGVHCIKKSNPFRHAKQHWRAALYLIAQGSKEVILGQEVYRCDEAHHFVSPIDLPISGRVLSATPKSPFLCLKLDFDSTTLNEVAAMLEKPNPRQTNNPLRAMFVGKTTEPMHEAAVRLGKLLHSPEDAVALGPLVIKEIFYHLLKGQDGPAIRQFVRSGSKTYKISQAIFTLKSELSDGIDTSALAKSASMSRSAFFKYFKEMTAMSPIQYQKRLRLLEARRLMTEEEETAESAAFKVGYNSASQFSREYSRMFGNSPVRDTIKSKKVSKFTTDEL